MRGGCRYNGRTRVVEAVVCGVDVATGLMKGYGMVQGDVAKAGVGVEAGRPPWAVWVLAVVGVLYGAMAVTEWGMGLPALLRLHGLRPGSSVLPSLAGMAAVKGPWVGAVLFSTWGLLRGRGPAWVAGVMLSSWMIVCVVIQVFFLGLLLYADPQIPAGGRALGGVLAAVGRIVLERPAVGLLPGAVLVLLLGRGVRAWSAPAWPEGIRWVLGFGLFGLGWVWMTLLLPREHLPRAVSGSSSSWVFTLLGVVCWLGFWTAGYGVLRRRRWGFVLGQGLGAAAIVVLTIALAFRFSGVSRALVYGMLGLFGKTDAFLVGILLRGYPIAGGVLVGLGHLLMLWGLWRWRAAVLSAGLVTAARRRAVRPRDGSGWEAPLGVLAAFVLGVHLLGVFLGLRFLLSTAMMIMSLVPVSVVYLLVRLGVSRRGLTRRQIGLRGGLAGGMVVVLLVLYLTPGFLMCFPLADLGLRFRVWRAADLGRIQAWAVGVLKEPGKSVTRNGADLDLAKAPGFVDALAPEMAYLGHGAAGERHVRLIWGGGVQHMGLLVGPRTFRTRSNERQWVRRWRDGVYGYQEIR